MGLQYVQNSYFHTDWRLDLLHTLIQRVATRDSSLLHTHTLAPKVTSSQPLLGSGFGRRNFPFLWLPELSPCLSYQLLNNNGHNDLTPAVLWLAHSPTNLLHSTPLHCTALTKLWVSVRVALQLAAYRQSVRLGAKPLEDHDQRFCCCCNWTFAVIVLM
jgi:hypothetical protein